MSDEDVRDRILREAIELLMADPAQLKLNVIRHHGGVIYEVTVPDADKPRILGKEGRTAQSFRTLMTALWGKVGVKAQFVIVQ
jgi:predicted RNA-binding protein YlqC (UPF0109 family)